MAVTLERRPGVAVVHLAGGDQLVARVLERRERAVELVHVLRFHVLAHDAFPVLAKGTDVFVGWHGLGSLLIRR